MLHRLAFPALVAATVFAPSAVADTLKVPQTYPTIQEALGDASPGDVILVSSGIYRENVIVGLALDGLEIRGKGQVIIDAIPLDAEGGGSPDGIAVFSPDVTLKNLTIRHAPENGIRAEVALEGIFAGDGLVVDKCTIINCGSEGIRAVADDITVTGCTLVGNVGGVFIQGSNAVVTKTTVTNDDQQGIVVDGSDAQVTNCTVDVIEDGPGIDVEGANCLVDKNKVSNTCGDLIHVTSNNGVVSRNTVWAGDEDGIDASGTNITVEKNRAMDTGEDSDGINVEGDGCIVDGNRVERASENGFELDISGGMVMRNRCEMSGSEDEAGFELNGDGNTVENNVAADCDSSGFVVNGDGNTLSKNKSTGNTDNGFYVRNLGSVDNVFTQNKAMNNHGEGFQNDGVGTRLGKNTLKKNRIDLANRGSNGASAVDDGGNKFDTGGFTTEPEVL